MKPILFVLIFLTGSFSLNATGIVNNYGNRFARGIDPPAGFDSTPVDNRIPEMKCTGCPSKISPEPGAKLNYTQIMFEHPPVAGVDEYLVEIAFDEGANSFTHLLCKQKDSSAATMIGNFEFGKKYVWRYTGLRNGKEQKWNGPYHFETLYNPSADKKLFRVRVLQNDSPANAGGLIVLDVSGNIVDRKGNFVWFLPPDTGNTANPHPLLNENIRALRSLQNMDMRITPFGTVTLLNGGRAEERDLKGSLLWAAPPQSVLNPGSDVTYGYHHCFKRLSGGNYVVLDLGVVTKPALPLSKPEVSSSGTAVTDTGRTMVTYEIIKEFDRNRKLVWNWSSEDYFDKAELRRMVEGKPDPEVRNKMPGGHMNAFDVDEKNGFVYAGFRNVSRIIKVDKKSGLVVCSWGDNQSYRGGKKGYGFFFKQHGITLLRDGSIAVFDNNNKKRAEVSESASLSSGVIIFNQPTDSLNSRIIWKFDCNLDSVNNISTSGGNVDELKNGNLLADMGNVNRVFEITRNKRLVWSALIEKYDELTSTWNKFPLYRAHYASSLYPCYFTVQTNADTVNKMQASFQLRVFNDGTEDDSYQVNISSSSGYYNRQFSTVVLHSRKSISFKIAPVKLPVTNDEIQVTVKSKTNPDFIRTVYVQYSK